MASVDMHPQVSAVESILTKVVQASWGGSQDRSRVKKKQDNWPKINKDLDKLSYISGLNHLLTVLLLTIEDTHTLYFWVCIYA